jgi:predicted DNA-binding protein (UPF0278 family)
VIVKAILPVEWFESVEMKEEAMTEYEARNSIVTSFRKSYRESLRKQNSLHSVKDF